MQSLYQRLLSILKRAGHNQQDSALVPHSSATRRVYLDNAGATEVGERAKRALLESLATYGNPSGIHKEGADAGILLDKARALCATVLNAHAYEIYFMSSGTESCNLAILGTYHGYRQQTASLADNRPQILPHIVVSSIEHPAILEPVRFLEREGKVRVTYLPVYEDGVVKVRDVQEALSPETILVSVMYANNEIGTIQPIKEIGRAVDEWKRSQGKTFSSYPYVHTDACQATNYCNLDVLRLKVHMMTVNSSKIYGPKGIALLYKREGISVAPCSYGGGQERQLRSGTENVAGAYALGVALTETQDLQEQEVARLEVLRKETLTQLQQEIPSCVFYGNVATLHDTSHTRGTHEIKCLPHIINVRIPGISSEEMILRLDAKGFAVSHKSACASLETDGSYVLIALGATELEARENIRISMGRSTTKSDMERLVQTMREITDRYS